MTDDRARLADILARYHATLQDLGLGDGDADEPTDDARSPSGDPIDPSPDEHGAVLRPADRQRGYTPPRIAPW